MCVLGGDMEELGGEWNFGARYEIPKDSINNVEYKKKVCLESFVGVFRKCVVLRV